MEVEERQIVAGLYDAAMALWEVGRSIVFSPSPAWAALAASVRKQGRALEAIGKAIESRV